MQKLYFSGRYPYNSENKLWATFSHSPYNFARTPPHQICHKINIYLGTFEERYNAKSLIEPPVLFGQKFKANIL